MLKRDGRWKMEDGKVLDLEQLRRSRRLFPFSLFHLPCRRLVPSPAGVICFSSMFKRQRTGSVVCASCGSLVGVNDDQCYSCGRRNPGLWGFGRALREFGNDLGFVTLVIYACGALYVATLLFSAYIGEGVGSQNPLSMLGAGPNTLLAFGASGLVPV